MQRSPLSSASSSLPLSPPRPPATSPATPASAAPAPSPSPHTAVNSPGHSIASCCCVVRSLARAARQVGAAGEPPAASLGARPAADWRGAALAVARSLARSLARAGKRLPSGPGGAPSVTTNNLLATGQSGAARRRRRRRTRRKCMPNRARRAPLVVPTGDTCRSQNAPILDPDPQRGTNPRAAPIVPGTGAATLRVCHPGILVWLASKASRRASARATSARRRARVARARDGALVGFVGPARSAVCALWGTGVRVQKRCARGRALGTPSKRTRRAAEDKPL